MDESRRKKIVVHCWKTGSDALNKQSWDYAIEMFSQCVELEPENLMYRQVLRGAEHKKYNDNKKGAMMAGMKLAGTRQRIKRARTKEDWKTVDHEAEKGLLVNPWDAQLNADVGEACFNLGYSEVAKFAYEKAVEAEPANKEYLRMLAQILEDRGEYDQAIGCWDRVRKLDPLDSEARSKMTQLSADKVIGRGGYEEAKTTREVTKTAYDLDRPAQRNVPGAVEGPGVSVEADLQRAIRKDPASIDNYMKLAEYYRREKRLAEAAEQYRKALEVSGGDPNVREQLEDTELDILRQNRETAVELARANPDDETARQNATALAQELVQREIEVFSSRVERYPKDSRLKLDLAKRYMRVKRWGQAIPLLQQASADQRIESEVLVNLGKCFLQDNKKELGKRQFEKAIPTINVHDQPELFKEAHYLMGRLCEESGQREQAENHYSDILAIDYSYKDTLKRLEALQSGGGPTSGGDEAA